MGNIKCSRIDDKSICSEFLHSLPHLNVAEDYQSYNKVWTVKGAQFRVFSASVLDGNDFNQINAIFFKNRSIFETAPTFHHVQ